MKEMRRSGKRERTWNETKPFPIEFFKLEKVHFIPTFYSLNDPLYFAVKTVNKNIENPTQRPSLPFSDIIFWLMMIILFLSSCLGSLPPSPADSGVSDVDSSSSGNGQPICSDELKARLGLSGTSTATTPNNSGQQQQQQQQQSQQLPPPPPGAFLHPNFYHQSAPLRNLWNNRNVPSSEFWNFLLLLFSVNAEQRDSLDLIKQTHAKKKWKKKLLIKYLHRPDLNDLWMKRREAIIFYFSRYDTIYSPHSQGQEKFVWRQKKIH